MGHFYDLDGNPAYTVPNQSKGGRRDTTVRDARKLRLVPSYSTVVAVLAKAPLDRWKQLKLLEMVEQHPNLIGKGEDWKERLIGMNEDENSKYAKRGTEIHDSLESFYRSGRLDGSNDSYVAPIIDYIQQTFNPEICIPEMSFSHELGYGGKIDLVIGDQSNKYIIDFKTKSIDNPSSKQCYSDYAMQLSAYARAFEADSIRGHINILISTTNPGAFYVHNWDSEEIDKGFKAFKALLLYWQTAHDYDSRFTREQT